MKGGQAMIYRRLFDLPTFGAHGAFHELEAMRRQFNRLLNEWSATPRRAVGAGVFPLVNVTEDANKFYLRAELPGVTSDSLDVQAAGKTISISGERTISKEKANARYHRREREGGQFSRVLAMPAEIDANRIEAKLENGILTVNIPKAEGVKPRKIAVN
jgi:HSP20 family protein